MLENLKKSSLFLLLFLAITLVLTSVFYIFKMELSVINIILSFILTIISTYFIDKKNIIKIVLISLLVILVSILISTFIFDRSSDGNTYHKDAIATLYSGWNPVYNDSEKFTKNDIDGYDMHEYDIWKNHYAKANWILQANFYKLTNNIETGKSVNYILMYILFTLCYTYFYKLFKHKSLIISSIITFNPVVANQLFTFYNDQLGASLLFILLISLIRLFDSEDKSSIKEKFIYIFLTLIITINIKFNIMGYALIYTFIFMIYYLYKKYKNNYLKESLKKLVPLYIILFIISFGVVGYSTYIKNYVDHKNPFFPVYGEGKEDIITHQQPKNFVKMNSVSKNFVSLFSRSNNLQTNKKVEYKIPFTFKNYEFKESMAVDTRINGFGVFYSGLFITSIIIIGIYFKKMSKEEKNIISILLFTTLFLTIIISESWWARYSPQNYIIIPVSIYLLMKYSSKRIINYLFIGLVIVNSSIILLGNTYYSVKESITINKDLNKLKNKDIDVFFKNGNMTGILYNLKDYNIRYTVTDKELDKITYYNYLKYEVR